MTKILSKLDGIKTKVDNLVELGLIENLGPGRASRGSTITNHYKYTESGCLIAWILQSAFSTKKFLAGNQIYNLLFHVEDEPSSYKVFASRLCTKLKEQGVFGEIIVDGLRARLNNSNVKIMNMKELILSLGIIQFTDKQNAELYSRLVIETINELDEEMKRYVLQNIKLEIEEKMMTQVKHVRGFEELRYQLRDQPGILALEGVCDLCTLPSPVQIDTMQYIENTTLLSNDPIQLPCGRCGKDASITLPQI